MIWTPVQNGRKCDDYDVTTRDDRCINGNCQGDKYACLECEDHENNGCTLKPGYCVIKHSEVNKCFREYTENPENPCQVEIPFR